MASRIWTEKGDWKTVIEQSFELQTYFGLIPLGFICCSVRQAFDEDLCVRFVW